MQINLEEFKAFDRVDHVFLEAVLPAVRSGMNFHSWIGLAHALCSFIGTFPSKVEG